jgi:tRNA U34 5-methylaminomethyl-2-thiouridine-forming methyltransferase MnmC
MNMEISDYRALTVDEKTLKIVENFLKHEKQGKHDARKTARQVLREYLVETDDGSYTFKSESLDGKSETMHTHHGAVTEAREKFVKPARLEGKDKISVLDICSGLGYNAATCIEYLGPDVEIELDLVEISKETMALALLLDAPLKSYRIIQKAIEDELYERQDIKSRHFLEDIPDNISISLHIEDARETVKKLEGHNKYDAIFLDPFSPLKSPELYTIEFFTILNNLLKPHGIILTYTSAAPVRAAMVTSGLHVGEGPSFGRRGGTLASLNKEIIDKPLSMNDERMIALSDAGIPFHDPDLKGSSQEILQRRKQEREISRGNDRFSSTVKTPIYLNRELEEGRLKRRVLRNLNKLGFDDLTSDKSRFVVCPQYSDCICGRNCKNYDNSRERINEMNNRLTSLL